MVLDDLDECYWVICLDENTHLCRFSAVIRKNSTRRAHFRRYTLPLMILITCILNDFAGWPVTLFAVPFQGLINMPLSCAGDNVSYPLRYHRSRFILILLRHKPASRINIAPKRITQFTFTRNQRFGIKRLWHTGPLNQAVQSTQKVRHKRRGGTFIRIPRNFPAYHCSCRMPNRIGIFKMQIVFPVAWGFQLMITAAHGYPGKCSRYGIFHTVNSLADQRHFFPGITARRVIDGDHCLRNKMFNFYRGTHFANGIRLSFYACAPKQFQRVRGCIDFLG